MATCDDYFFPFDNNRRRIITMRTHITTCFLTRQQG